MIDRGTSLALSQGMKLSSIGLVLLALGSTFGLASLGCSADVDDGDEVDDLSGELSAGVNGSKCIASPYNCAFRATGGPRVLTAAGDDAWAVEGGAQVRDGNGTALATQSATKLSFNYGQTRFLAGKTHFLAMATDNGSAAWFPADHVVNEQSLRAKIGNVDAKDPQQGKMACYEIRSTYDASIEFKKVVYDSKSKHERAGDYLPLLRANGKVSANLVFSVPGFSLGGAVTDHFPAGSKFQRVVVPTTSGRPSIDIPLWADAGNGSYTKRSGSMKFVYGYIVSKSDGTKRFGWMAYDAIKPSSGCN